MSRSPLPGAKPPSKPGRRRFFRLAGARGATAALPLRPAAAQPARERYAYFSRTEAAFVEAACARLIPSDDTGPGAREAGVAAFIDRQLAGAWGAGERLYRAGPWQSGTPSQGYQLPFTPAELYRKAIRAIDTAGFLQRSPHEQEAWLESLQKGDAELDGIPSKMFFESLLALTIEGYFSDPVYGGNRGMAAWKMIGFPGAYASYYEVVDRHNVEFAAPRSIADAGGGHR